tara:strand:- start:3119 stop:3478 length:360 start_codon:yes stop_codon:yes gene_type:complete
MNIGQLLLSIEENFRDFTGSPLHGPLGILVGLTIFYLLLFILRYQKEDKKNFNFSVDDLSDVGDPIEANLNLTRSLIEMNEFIKAKDCLEIVEKSSEITQEQKEKALILRQKLEEKKNG